MKKDNSFSVNNRSTKLRHCQHTQFDLIVIGGGVTGAGILLDAVSRGLNCLLVEKGDFSSGTSGKSTKLIHGGLRYLKQLEIGLVREMGSERAIVHNIAPHLVHPEKMLLPIVANGSFGKLSASLAISIYDYLACVDKADRKKSLNKQQACQAEPLLKHAILKGGIMYSEYRTDDSRLTIELIKSAVSLGAQAFNYCEVIDLIYENDQVVGIKGRDEILQQDVTFKSKHVVSAAGPWVDQLRAKDQSLNTKKLRLTKGVHLVFDRKRLPINQAIYFDAFDGRMLFAIPRGGVTYVGTTDSEYRKDLDKVICLPEERDYILKAINQMLVVENLNEKDVISSWAGLRPLIHEDGKSPSELSRRDEIFISPSGLISIAGGKLTGYRKMAERVLALIIERNPKLQVSKCVTGTLKLTDQPFDNYAQYIAFRNTLNLEMQKFSSVKDTKMDAESLGNYSRHLASTFGRDALQIWENSKQYYMEGFVLDQALIKSEIEFTIANESVYHPTDYFVRRTGMLYFNPNLLKRNFDFIHDCFSKFMKWSESTNLLAIKKSKEVYCDATFENV